MSYVEGLIPKEFGADAVEVLGARSLLAELEKAKAPWAIVVRSFFLKRLSLVFTIYLKVFDGSICPDFWNSPVSDRMARCHAACSSKKHGRCGRRQTRKAW